MDRVAEVSVDLLASGLRGLCAPVEEGASDFLTSDARWLFGGSGRIETMVDRDLAGGPA